MKNLDAKQLKSLTLAYIGDAVYELHTRTFLVHRGLIKPHELHDEAIKFVSGKSQASILHHWLETEYLTDDEISIVKRGRNAKTNSSPKNLDIQTYRYSTGFEALIGYYFLQNDKERLQELLNDAMTFVMKREGNYE